MSAPFMQLYVADYLGDTRHLTTEQHGAYLLLLMTMWRSDGRLPNDTKKLARIAGCSPSRWTKIADEVMEFFTIDGDEITNPRLTSELEKAQEKSIKRAVSGSKGGRAKSLKTNKPDEANATGLLKHSSEPESEDNPPTPQGGEIDLKAFSKAVGLAASAGCSYPDLIDRIHLAQPVVDKRRKSVRPDVERALFGALKRGGDPGAIWGAIQAFYALPASTKDGGQFANGAAVILNRDRWKEFVPSVVVGMPTSAPSWSGPPAVRASIVQAKDEDFARKWVDPYCSWSPMDRTLLVANAYAAKQIRQELGGWFARNNAHLGIAPANDTPPLLAHGDAA